MSKEWWLGLVLVVSYVLLSELTSIFNGYFYSRLGLDRNLILMTLWILPLVASFLVSFLSKNKKILMSILYIPILSLLGPLVHFLLGESGVVVDFTGLAGLKYTFQLYFIFSVVIISLGAFLGKGASYFSQE